MNEKTKNNQGFTPIFCEPWKPTEVGQTISGVIIEMSSKYFSKDVVPYIHLVTEDGEEIEVLMSAASLRALVDSGALSIGGHLSLRYNGESTVIEKAGNFAKLYSYRYVPEGQDEPIRIVLKPPKSLPGVSDEMYEKLRETGKQVAENGTIQSKTTKSKK